MRGLGGKWKWGGEGALKGHRTSHASRDTSRTETCLGGEIDGSDGHRGSARLCDLDQVFWQRCVRGRAGPRERASAASGRDFLRKMINLAMRGEGPPLCGARDQKSHTAALPNEPPLGHAFEASDL